MTITNEMIEAAARALCRNGASFPTIEQTVAWVDEKWPRFKDEAILALTAAEKARKVEPIAWLSEKYEGKRLDDTHVTFVPSVMEAHKSRGYEITPLYASPPTQPDAVGAGVPVDLVGWSEPDKPLLATRFKLSFDGKGRCTTFRKDQAEKLEGQWVWLLEAKNGMNAPLKSAISDAVYELRKFFAQTLDWADENGWADPAGQKDRIVYWFGPSDFLEMRQMIERLEALEDGQ